MAVIDEMSRAEAERLFGLDSPYTKVDLRKAIRSTMKKYHPDRAEAEGFTKEEAESHFVLIRPAQQKLEQEFKGKPDDYAVTPMSRSAQSSQQTASSSRATASTSTTTQQAGRGTGRGTTAQSDANPSTRGRGTQSQRAYQSGRTTNRSANRAANRAGDANGAGRSTSVGQGAGTAQATQRATTTNASSGHSHSSSYSAPSSASSSAGNQGQGPQPQGAAQTLYDVKNTMSAGAIAVFLFIYAIITDPIINAIEAFMNAIGLGAITPTSIYNAVEAFFDGVSYSNGFAILFIQPLHLIFQLVFLVFMLFFPIAPFWLIWKIVKRHLPQHTS